MGVAARPMMGRSIIVLGRTVGRGPDIVIALLLYLSMNDTPCFECKCHIVLLKAVIAWHVEVGILIRVFSTIYELVIIGNEIMECM